MAQTTTPAASALGAAGVAGLSDEELFSELDALFRVRASIDGRIVERLGEVGRREAFRDQGATSVPAWAVERFAVSGPTARAFAHVAERAWDLPHLSAALNAGEVSFDKVRAVVDVATPETDRSLLDAAKECSVRQLADVARLSQQHPVPESRAERDYDRRWLRFSDTFRTVSVQLPAESYAETKTCLEDRARDLPSDGDTGWDQRLCDAFLLTVRGDSDDSKGGRSKGSFVVVHVPLATLADESSELAGELERDGLVSAETVRRIACDATVAIAVDDDVGKTMYEGRARRWPSDSQRREIMRRDRHCRFPGCTNVTFTNVHHIAPWKPGGRTDLDNLALLCVYHHHRVHSRRWTLSGDANAALTFVGPTGRVMTSRPSPLWTAVTGPEAIRAAGDAATGN
jgi:hypothetical protein